MNKLLATTTIAAGMALGLMAPAKAVPLSSTFAATVYQYTNPSPGDGSNASQQALPSATATPGATISTFTYTGALNFNEPLNGTNTVSAFIASGGGTTTGTVPTTALSGGNFTTTSLFKFTFTTTGIGAGTILHDDGISLFVSGNTTTDLLPVSASSPTALASTSFTNLAAGTYDLYYSEVNGLPADLTFNIPEPSTFMLLGAGLIGIGAATRRARRNS